MKSTIYLFVFLCAWLSVSKICCKPVAVASVIHGTENDKFCAKTEGEKEKQLKAEERDDLYEGDVIMTVKLAKTIEKMNKTKQRDVISLPNMKWKSSNIPYVFDASISDRTKEVVKSACADYAKYTCIKCVERSTETDYIRFFVGKGCWSFVGRQGGKQDISLGSGCDFKGTVIHEMLHALGFFHEQTRLDRDDFVTINWDAIKTGADVNFKKYAVGTAEYYDEPYDYSSIMHYPENAFSKDTRKTIIVKPPFSGKIGQREGLSDIDIKQIKKAYKCSDSSPPVPGSINTATTVATPPIPPSATTAKPLTTATSKVTTAGPPSTPNPGVSTATVPPPVTSSKTTASSTNAPTQPTVTDPTQNPILPTKEGQVTTPINVNLGGQRPGLQIKITTGVEGGTYPTWPNDFNWNTNGVPQSCNCQSCQCQCVHVNEPSAGIEWKNNYLCYKRGISNPELQWSSEGPLKGRRCTHISDPTFGKYWDNNFLCVPKDSPYHFAWSSKGPLNQEKFSCLKMNVPGGPKEWQDNFLCAIKTAKA